MVMQALRKSSNKYLKELEKEQPKPKMSRQKDIIKIREEINKTDILKKGKKKRNSLWHNGLRILLVTIAARMAVVVQVPSLDLEHPYAVGEREREREAGRERKRKREKRVAFLKR